MALARRGLISDVSFSYRLTERLGGLVLKDKQEEALKSLLDGKMCLLYYLLASGRA